MKAKSELLEEFLKEEFVYPSGLTYGQIIEQEGEDWHYNGEKRRSDIILKKGLILCSLYNRFPEDEEIKKLIEGYQKLYPENSILNGRIKTSKKLLNLWEKLPSYFKYSKKTQSRHRLYFDQDFFPKDITMYTLLNLDFGILGDKLTKILNKYTDSIMKKQYNQILKEREYRFSCDVKLLGNYSYSELRGFVKSIAERKMPRETYNNLSKLLDLEELNNESMPVQKT
jgi:hypothetical protein